jgi:hypothetical protein
MPSSERHQRYSLRKTLPTPFLQGLKEPPPLEVFNAKTRANADDIQKSVLCNKSAFYFAFLHTRGISCDVLLRGEKV